jgi:hypothetical protein
MLVSWRRHGRLVVLGRLSRKAPSSISHQLAHSGGETLGEDRVIAHHRRNDETVHWPTRTPS